MGSLPALLFEGLDCELLVLFLPRLWKDERSLEHGALFLL